jgi:uncharacterized membrane protein
MSTHRRLARIARNKFVAGLLILVPIVLTVKGLWWLFDYVDGLADPLAAWLLGRHLAGVGFVTTLAVIFVTGVLFSAGPLSRLLRGLEQLVDMVPVVGTVYGTTKQVLAGFGDGAGGAFERFVLVHIRDRTVPGFLTKRFDLVGADGTRAPRCVVYVPTNHLYLGDLIVVAPEDIQDTSLSVEEGMGMVLSAGASTPDLIAIASLAGSKRSR